ncbi:DNA polymerase III subunit alpha [Crocinitomicaceae bacterium]|nr:DNA polymerase III subunit alpha [Crocinitomicaceae bacterium]
MYLNTHTYYSMRYGVVSPDDLLEMAVQNGCSTIAVTDINSTSACLEIVREASKKSILPIVGVDFRNGVQQKFVMLAKNNSGFQKINSFLTEILHNNSEIPDNAPTIEDTFVIYPFDKNTTRILRSNEYVGITPDDIPSLRLKNTDTIKGVVLQTVTFRNKKDFNTHRLLRAIDNNTLLSKLNPSEQGKPNHKMRPIHELKKQYNEFPFLIENTKSILDQCTIDFDFSSDRKHQNQKTYTGDKKKDEELLEHLCKEGLLYRYPNANQEVHERIDKELKMIKKMNFVSYFLMNWDIITYAKRQGYFYVGRGSGANSVVAYLLQITNVDPIELDLYFERFINLYRTNPPDFDIDFSWRDRDDITRYIFERFNHVALVAAYNTFKDRSVIRELGKVFGLPKEEIDKLTHGSKNGASLNHLSDLVIKYSKYIHGLPSHLSIHASGIVITEQPIQHFSATFLPPKGYPTIQFDMHIAEDVGLFKFDILSQRGLSKIKDALDLIYVNHPNCSNIDIHNINTLKKDTKIRTLLKSAQTIGCFYVESPAMRMLLTKLQVDNYLGLVAASSIIRPGVAKSGMMQEYIKRYRHPEKRQEAHPVLLKLMPETYGVMVYQEDVIKVAHHFAGLTLAEADKMRRGMSGKFRSREEFQTVKQQFFKNCTVKKRYPEQLTYEIWRQTESFAGYAFAKGHSASYAVESYQCLFLKAYYPLEFMVATINNAGGFYNTELYIMEAKLLGGKVHPPCINNSEQLTQIDGQSIHLGFHLIKGFDGRIAQEIVLERKRNGKYLDFDDFIQRVKISLEHVTTLIRIDALRFSKKNKRSLLWEAHFKLNKMKKNEPKNTNLFEVQTQRFHIPQLKNTWQEDAFDQIELLGFTLHSVFKLLLQKEKFNAVLAEELVKYTRKKIWVKGYLIQVKKTTTSKGEHMYFGTFIDQKGHWIDTVHFPDVSKQFRFRGIGVYAIYGTVNVEYDCLSIKVEFMKKMGIIEDPRYAEIRDKKKEENVVTWNLKKEYIQHTSH